MPGVVGIDFDTKRVALVKLSGWPAGDRPIVEAWREVYEDGGLAGDRLGLIVRRVEGVLAQMAPDLVVIEDVPFVKNRHGFSSLAQMLGALRALCAVVTMTQAPGIPAVGRVDVVRGSDWKRSFGLSGNAKKAEVALAVEAEQPWVTDWTQDLKDAYALARHGLRA